MRLLLLRRALLGLVGASVSTETSEVCNFLVAPFPILAQNPYTNVDAFIADEDLGSSDQLFDSMLALAAEGTVQLDLLRHGAIPRLARKTNMPAHRLGGVWFQTVESANRG
jgi:hypothetical protein